MAILGLQELIQKEIEKKDEEQLRKNGFRIETHDSKLLKCIMGGERVVALNSIEYLD